MDELHFQMRFVGKQFGKTSRKCEKEAKTERLKVKRAIEKGNLDGARIYAQNAIRKKNEALNYLRLQSRIDAVSSKIETAVKMRQVTQGLRMTVRGMDRVLSSMNPEDIARAMDKFERQFDDLDVTTQYVEGAVQQSTALTVPEDQVADLMAQVADEYDLDLQEEARPQPGRADPLGVQYAELSERLERLRGQRT